MKLFEHQISALKQTEGFNRCAYYLDMGLGKTFVGSEKMIKLKADVNLVICQKSKVDDWFDHIYENTIWTPFDLTHPKDYELFWERVDVGDKCLVGIINYELAWRRPELLKLENFTLMLDESSLIQNRTAKQTKFIMKMNPANVILLSGTPCSGKYENLWTQAHLLGWDISPKLYETQYVEKEFVLDGRGRKIKNPVNGKFVQKIVGYQNTDRLKSKFRQHGSVFMKTEDAFNLPEQTFIDINVDTSKEYRRFIKSSYVVIDDVELMGDTSLTKLLYARELCSIYSEAKLQAFDDLVKSTQDRLIVFYNFKDELDRLVQIAADNERPMSYINGSEKDLAMYESESNSITFCQYQAASMGMNLQRANKIVYYSLPLRSELFEQSKKRIHRIGQDLPCFYYTLICKGSVEEQIKKTLEMRKDYTDALFEQYIDGD